MPAACWTDFVHSTRGARGSWPRSSRKGNRPLESGRGQLHVRLRPCLSKALVHLRGLGRLALGAQALGEPEQRPAVVRVPSKILAVDLLGVTRTAGLEQHGA